MQHSLESRIGGCVFGKTTEKLLNGGYSNGGNEKFLLGASFKKYRYANMQAIAFIILV